jgi:alpha-galactosidase
MKTSLFRLSLLVVAMWFAISLIWNADTSALDNGLALTPPMGWNSWNTFHCDVDEELIRGIADAMVSSGMKDAGYEYVVIDDCWQVDRDAEGNILPDPERFPSGMKALADYVHSKGLKFGLYSDAGTATCQGRPGSRGYEFQDARQYAAWGVDYLKYDWCNTGTQDVKSSYSIMRDALKTAGRPIVFSICEWGRHEPWLWGKDVGNLWRSTGDITDCWDCMGRYVRGVMQILDQQVDLWQHAGPGYWNDPDMLEVGNPGLTLSESRAHFSLWSILAAPLMAGNDLRSMSPEVVEILTHREVIAVNQDRRGVQGHKFRDYGDTEVWRKPLVDDATAFVLLNRSETEKEIRIRVDPGAKVRDLWKKEDLGGFEDGWYSARVAPHDVAMIKVKP